VLQTLHPPDHDLVVSVVRGVARVGGGEDIVGDVCADAGGAVGPRDGRGHARHRAHELALGHGAAAVGVTLDVVLAALPRPRGPPLDAGVGRRVDVGTLRARRCLVLAPFNARLVSVQMKRRITNLNSRQKHLFSVTGFSNSGQRTLTKVTDKGYCSTYSCCPSMRPIARRGTRPVAARGYGKTPRPRGRVGNEREQCISFCEKDGSYGGKAALKRELLGGRQ
jgi:hypothetical protein